MKIKEVTFVASYPEVSKCPKIEIPEFAFIGRSNVGKSSLLNFLANNSKLAKISSKPGKTKLINFFLINKHFHFVDLPGYGYAHFAKREREKWEKIITNYILSRQQLLQLFILVDIRLKPQTSDINAINFMGKYEIPFSIIFTKIDKISKQKLKTNITEFEKVLYKTWEELPPRFITSSTKKIGKENILNYMESLLLQK